MTISVGAFVFNGLSSVGRAGAGPMAAWAQYWLGPSQWHGRLPYYMTVTGANSITGSFSTQAHFDYELKAAGSCGLQYLAHDFCPIETGWWNGTRSDLIGTNQPLDLHFTSDHKSFVKPCINFCAGPFMLATGDRDWPSIQAQLVSWFDDPDYMTVNISGTDRPLMYLYAATEFVTYNYGGDAVTAKADIDALRSASTVNPYIIGLGTNAAVNIATLGLDARGRYSELALSAGETYDTFKTRQEASWVTDAASIGASQRMPGWSAGINFSPISDQPLESYYHLGEGENVAGPWNVAPTVTELNEHIINAMTAAEDFEAQTTCGYAWNEYLECAIGGFLPTRGDYGRRLQTFAETYGRQRDNHRVLRTAGYSITTA